MNPWCVCVLKVGLNIGHPNEPLVCVCVLKSEERVVLNKYVRPPYSAKIMFPGHVGGGPHGLGMKLETDLGRVQGG